jgi:SAM-dependent methyltransferase
MPATIAANLYDYPQYYDLIFGADWKEEFRFLQDCFRVHALGEVRRVFEPACGTGRLLAKLAAAGFEVSGLDLNLRAVDYCNRRLVRKGFRPDVFVGDMADFRLKRPIDAAFNTINSFRHLATEQEAESHLRCVARALRPGGIYVLGLHLTPTSTEPMQEERWSARRGTLSVRSKLKVLKCDMRQRREVVRMVFDVRTPSRQFRLEDRFTFRTYSGDQMRRLLGSIAGFEVTAVYDFGYDIQRPAEIGPETEDVVYVLRKRGR